jgi:hypothetical protein
MGNFFDRLAATPIGKLITYTEEDEAPTAAAPAPASATPSRPVAAPKVVAAAVDQQILASLDDSAKKQLIDAMEKSGAHFVEEFSDYLETLRESIEDEAGLYKAALKLLLKKGGSLSAIRQDFDKCIGALEAKDREFGAQLKGELDRRVGTKQKTVADCQAQIEAKQEQIQKLQSEIGDLGATAHEAQGGISAEQDKLNLAQSRFTLVYKALRSEIEANSAKVTQYGEKL